MNEHLTKHRFQRPSVNNTELDTWFERDRAYVGLKDTGTDTSILEFWDDCVGETVEDGFLSDKGFIMGKMMDSGPLHESMVAYALEHGATVKKPLIIKPCADDSEG